MEKIRTHPLILSIPKIASTIFLYLNCLLILSMIGKYSGNPTIQTILTLSFHYFPSVIALLLARELFEDPFSILLAIIAPIIYPNYLFSYVHILLMYHSKKLTSRIKKIQIPGLFDFTIDSSLNVIFLIVYGIYCYGLSKIPMINITIPFFDSALFMIMVIFCNCYLFYKGIHPNYIHFFIYPIQYLFLLENIQAFNVGDPLVHLFTHGAMSAFCNLSGTGITIGIALLDKSLSKEALHSALFGVNEPVIFGLPVANNQHAFFPFVIGGTFLGAIPVILMKMGYLAKPLFEAPYIGLGLEGLLVNFDIKTLFVNMLQILLSILIWIPYARKKDHYEI